SARSPSMSPSSTGSQPGGRWYIISFRTSASARGRLPGRIIRSWLLSFHSRAITLAISLRTPRVTWKPSMVVQSSYSRSNTSGWLGYARHKRSKYRPPLRLARQLGSLGDVGVREGPANGVAAGRIPHRLEQPPPHDLERFLGGHRLPQGLHPT